MTAPTIARPPRRPKPPRIAPADAASAAARVLAHHRWGHRAEVVVLAQQLPLFTAELEFIDDAASA